MGKRHKLHEMTRENDIRYRGPLSYQGFQILGWACIVISALILMLRAGQQVDPQLAKRVLPLISVLTFICPLSLPFLLIANFAKILNNQEGYKKLLLVNGCAALGIFALAYFVFSRYVIGAISQFVTDPEEVLPLMTSEVRLVQKNGFIAFNIFIDLFLCTLFMFFLDARPKRVFTGKKRYIFRAFAILPIACEVFSLYLKGRSAEGLVRLPLWSFPLLTVKPPMTFAVFIVLAVYIKTRELRFRRHGKTHEEYKAFLQTNRNSLHFSVFLSIIMVIAAVLDLLFLTFLSAQSAGSFEALNTNDAAVLEQYMTVGNALGFGESVFLAAAAPFVLLFSYTRIPKNKRVSILIPAAAIVLIVIMLIEGCYQALGMIADQMPQKVSIRDLMNTLAAMAGT